MSSTELGAIVFACLFGAAMLGIVLRNRLPSHHLDSESRDAIRMSTAVVGTLSALALGLLISSAKTVFDTSQAELQTSVSRVLLLNSAMAEYGPETKTARAQLQSLVGARLVQGWGTDEQRDATNPYDESQSIEPIQAELRDLTPTTDSQRLLQARALDISGQLAEAHWMLVDPDGQGLPTAFLVILVFWLTWLFATFGLHAPANPTVIGVMFVCSVSVATAVFLVIDMAHPYIGFIHVSDAPLRAALAHLRR